MAITEDASTPAIVSGGGTGTTTTASFSPPANSLLVALVAGGYGTTLPTGATISDSAGGTWTTGPAAAGTNAAVGGIAKIFTRYLASAPGSITVSAAFTNLIGGRMLAVRVLAGAASSQAGAGSGSAVHDPASNNGGVSVTTTTVGSVVYGITDDGGLNQAPTVNANTSILSPGGDFSGATDGVELVAWKAAAATTTPGAATYGVTFAPANVNNAVGLEILPVPTGIQEDASRPVVLTATGAGTQTTASFSPPANSLLLVLVAGGYGTTNPTGVTITDSGSHTWTAPATATGTATNKGVAKIYYCYLSSAPGSITVTATYTNLTGGRLLDVHVLTGAASDQSTGTAATSVRSTATTAATIGVALTTQDSRVYGICADPDTASAFTANGSTTVATNYNDTTDGVRLVSWKAAGATGSLDVGTTATYGGTWATAQTSNTAAFEVLPASTATAYAGAATLEGGASLGAPAALTEQAVATLSGAATLTAAATQTQTSVSTLAGTSSLTVGGVRVQPGAATLAGAAGLTVPTGTLTATSAATLLVTSGLTAAAFLTEPITLTLTGTSSLTSAGTRVQPGAVTFAGAATLTAAGVSGAGATLLAAGSLTSTPVQGIVAAAALPGLATFTGPGWVTQRATVTLTGSAVLVSNLGIPAGATLPATAALSVAAISVYAGAATLPAVSALGPSATLVLAATGSLPGTATLTAGAFRIAGGTGVLFAAAATLRAGATADTPGQVLSVTFWALNNDGTYNAALPDLVSWQLSLVDSSPGAVTLDYPADGRNFDVLRNSVTADRDLLVAIWVGGKDPGSLRAILNTAEGDDVAESAVWRFSGNFLNVRMEEAGVAPRTSVVTPPTGPPPTTDLAAFRVYAATAGTVMATLMAEAQARGGLSDITYIFTATVDSHGVPWSKTITLKIAPGTDYLTVLTSLVEAQMCEWEIIDHELTLWESGTRGVDYTATVPPIILRAGDTLTDSPRKHTVRGAATTLTVAGGEGLYTTASDATALARRGRRIEQFFSQGSLTDAGSLSAYAAAKLPTTTAGVMEVGGGIALTGTGPEPLITYRLGDWLWYDTGLGLERLRIKQLTVSCDSDGILTAGLSLNDLIADQLEQLAHRLTGIEGGTTITGTSNASPVIPDVPDTMPPAAPAGVVVTSLAQPSAEAVPRSAVSANWAAPTTNEDATAVTDLAGYTVQWRYLNSALGTNWVQLASVTSPPASWSGVIAGEAIEVRVAAFDLTGNTSAWSTSGFATTQADSTPPPVPSAPTVGEFLGTLTVTWNGLGSVGEVMPTDFSGVQVHRSITTGFTPGSTTFIESMTGPGSRNYPDLPLGVTQFFKLISYDRTGNLSAPSAQASGVPAPVGMGDIAFSDPGNLVEDGSFEVGTSRATHTARSDTAWTFVSGGADNGTWSARGTGSVGSGLRALVLSPKIPTTPGSDYAIRWAMRATGVNGDVSMRVRWTLAATTTDTISTFTPGFSSAWTNTEVGNGVFTAPAGAVSLQIIVMLHANCTTGTWDIDRVEARETIGTLLVRNLAVTDAQIASASVGKLTAGTITAVMLMAGLLRSGTTGLRYEIDANGVRFYDASNNLVIDLNRASASATVTGTLQTGLTGRRIVVSGPTNTIKFLPQADESRWAQLNSYVPVGYPNDVAVQLQAISSAVTDVIARLYVLPDQVGLVVETSGGTIVGGAVEVQRDGVTLSLKDHNGGVGGGGLVALGRDSAQFGILNIDTSPSIDCHLAFDSTGAIDLQGKFTAGSAPSDKTAVLVGTATATNGVSVFYGSTMQGTMTPMVTLKCSTPFPVCVTAKSATNFNTSWTNTTGETVTAQYWVYRT